MNRLTTRNWVRFLLPALLTFALSGCVYDSYDDCFIDHIITVRAYSIAGSTDDQHELTGDEVTEVLLYVFDHNRRFVERIETQIGETLTFSSLMGRNRYLIAWGNTQGSGQMPPDLQPGDPMSMCNVAVATQPRASVVASPNLADVFSGSVVLDGNQLSGDHLLPLYRRTGQMHITGLRFDPAADYTVVVSSTPSILNGDGTNAGSQMVYTPTGKFDEDGRFIVDVFNLVPGDNITVQIIKNNGEQTWTVTQDINNNPIAIKAGQLTQVALRLSDGNILAIFVEVRTWDSVLIIKDW
ncbi:MAG: FimB/Mfa2 family fimbrial subunit [Dysgonamonadaceae bacterium]|jgi:hypothetical protein|nr:FimB/Mfa2 family fimbrial subunit [Dysgonamonadaceae bacterium]